MPLSLPAATWLAVVGGIFGLILIPGLINAILRCILRRRLNRDLEANRGRLELASRISAPPPPPSSSVVVPVTESHPYPGMPEILPNPSRGVGVGVGGHDVQTTTTTEADPTFEDVDLGDHPVGRKASIYARIRESVSRSLTRGPSNPAVEKGGNDMYY